MKTWMMILVFFNGMFWGYLLGFKWSSWQWIHCAENNIIMRIKGKYLYEVKTLKEE